MRETTISDDGATGSRPVTPNELTTGNHSEKSDTTELSSVEIAKVLPSFSPTRLQQSELRFPTVGDFVEVYQDEPSGRGWYRRKVCEVGGCDGGLFFKVSDMFTAWQPFSSSGSGWRWPTQPQPQLEDRRPSPVDGVEGCECECHALDSGYCADCMRRSRCPSVGQVVWVFTRGKKTRGVVRRMWGRMRDEWRGFIAAVEGKRGEVGVSCPVDCHGVQWWYDTEVAHGIVDAGMPVLRDSEPFGAHAAGDEEAGEDDVGLLCEWCSERMPCGCKTAAGPKLPACSVAGCERRVWPSFEGVCFEHGMELDKAPRSVAKELPKLPKAGDVIEVLVQPMVMVSDLPGCWITHTVSSTEVFCQALEGVGWRWPIEDADIPEEEGESGDVVPYRGIGIRCGACGVRSMPDAEKKNCACRLGLDIPEEEEQPNDKQPPSPPLPVRYCIGIPTCQGPGEACDTVLGLDTVGDRCAVCAQWMRVYGECDGCNGHLPGWDCTGHLCPSCKEMRGAILRKCVPTDVLQVAMEAAWQALSEDASLDPRTVAVCKRLRDLERGV